MNLEIVVLHTINMILRSNYDAETKSTWLKYFSLALKFKMFWGMRCLSILGRYLGTPESVQCLHFKIAGMEINANLTNNVEKMENAKFCTICVLGPGVLGTVVIT